jgi:hypothetical protein
MQMGEEVHFLGHMSKIPVEVMHAEAMSSSVYLNKL